MRIVAVIGAGALYGAMSSGLIPFPGISDEMSTRSETILEKAKRDETVSVRKGDADMELAFRKAKATLPEFLARARRPTVTNYSVKVAVHDGDEVEYFWIRPFVEKDGRFVGRINNTPRSVRNVREGQVISFEREEIFDWLYVENGKMAGNFTACALMKNEPPQQAEALKARYGMTCD